MVRGDQVREIGGEEEAARLRESYRSVASLTGAQFGEAFFEGVAPRPAAHSEPPAIGLAAFRLMAPGRSELESPTPSSGKISGRGAIPAATSFTGG